MHGLGAMGCPPIRSEEGRWTHSNGKYTTVTTRVAGEPVDTNDPQFTDEYIVESLAGDVMTCYHARLNLTFTSRKVSCFRSDA